MCLGHHRPWDSLVVAVNLPDLSPNSRPDETGFARLGHAGMSFIPCLNRKDIFMSETLCFVGIDVSKSHLDVASRPDAQEFRLANSPEGITALVDRLKALSPALILLEATGGLEQAAAVALAEAGLPIRIVEPGRIRHFARSIGQHSKTDSIDARVLAHYAEAVRPEARDLPDARTRDLQALLDRRR